MMTRLFLAPALALACMLMLSIDVEAAPRCGRFVDGRSAVALIKCPDVGRAVKRDRRPFLHRADRDARRGVAHRGHRVLRAAAVAPAPVVQWDDTGRYPVSHAVAPVRLARAGTAPRGLAVAEILPHPRGCPKRLFCGCGAAVKVFGAPIRSLWRAAHWLQFPRADPAPGMVAVRAGGKRGHVFVIEEVVSPTHVIAYDANSGKGLTRRHMRSLAGYSVRNPHARS
jgi:hypothetical protein